MKTYLDKYALPEKSIPEESDPTYVPEEVVVAEPKYH